MIYLFLAECLVICLFFALQISDGDFFAPAPLFVAVFIFVSTLSFVGLISWNNVLLGPLTFFIVFTGCLSFILGAAFNRLLKTRRSSAEWNTVRRRAILDICNFTIGTWKIIFLLVFIASASYIKIREIHQIGGSSDLASAIATTRYRTSAVFSDSSNASERFSTLVLQFDKIVGVIGFIMAFVLANATRAKKGYLYISLCSICFLAACGYSMLGGGRGGALGLFVSLIFAWRVVDLRERKNSFSTSMRLARRSLLLLAILLPLFYLSVSLVGRDSNSNFAEYISFYFGGGLPSLEYKVANSGGMSLNNPSYPFINSFYEMYQFMKKLGVVENLPAYGNDWVFFGTHASNIYTCFYRYYADFGFFGNIVLCFLAGLIYTAIYRLSVNSIAIWTVPFWLNIARTMVDVGRDETLFGHQLSALSFWTTLVYMIIMSWFLYGLVGIQTLHGYTLKNNHIGTFQAINDQ